MVFSRIQFFILLFIILIGPFIIYKVTWLANSRKTNGIVYFLGHTLELNGSTTPHFVVIFKVGKDTLTTNTGADLPYKIGDYIPLLYQKNDPYDVRVDLLDRIWGDTFVYSLLPLLILTVLFTTPQRFDPLIPRKSKVVVGRKPFIRIITNQFGSQ